MADGLTMDASRMRRRSATGTAPGQQLATVFAAGVALLAVAGVVYTATRYSSFWRTVAAMYLPLIFLLIAVGLFFFGRATVFPFAGIGRQQHTWSVVRLGREELLQVYARPDPRSPVVYRYWPTSRGLHSIGPSRRVGSSRWLHVTAPNGKGWVDAAYLTEEVDVAAFVGDDAPIHLLEDFVTALRGNGGLGRVLSPTGLVVALPSEVINVSAGDVAAAVAGLNTTRLTDSADLDLREHVLVPFLTAYAGTQRVTAEAAHSSTALLPTECENYLYLVLHNDAVGRPWLVFFEYRAGRPRVAGIGIDA
jgi:hypothetical protein